MSSTRGWTWWPGRPSQGHQPSPTPEIPLHWLHPTLHGEGHPIEIICFSKYSSQFPPPPLHTHTHIPQRVDESSAYYQKQERQAKQIMISFTLRRLKSQVLSQLPASWRRLSGRCTGAWWRGHSGSIRADMVNAYKGMLCVGRLWPVKSGGNLAGSRGCLSTPWPWTNLYLTHWLWKSLSDLVLASWEAVDPYYYIDSQAISVARRIVDWSNSV